MKFSALRIFMHVLLGRKSTLQQMMPRSFLMFMITFYFIQDLHNSNVIYSRGLKRITSHINMTMEMVEGDIVQIIYPYERIVLRMTFRSKTRKQERSITRRKEAVGVFLRRASRNLKAIIGSTGVKMVRVPLN